MQSHHNTGVSANSVRNTLNLFRPLGVIISISELDVLSQSWSDHSSSRNPTNAGKLQAANLFGGYFKLFLDNADIIERVSFWGVSDNRSWRSISLPQIFDANGKAKPAYYRIIGALEEYRQENS
jgi:GH35 family endo-1,4-beta-xylanase